MPSSLYPPESPIQLDVDAIRMWFSPTVLQELSVIDAFDSIGSTQEYLKIQTPSKQLCIAESQLEGKGRRGRDWVAAERGDVLFSLSWVYKSVPTALSALSLAVAVEIAESLAINYNLPTKIKWPNDLLLSNAKLAGIIIDVETGEFCRIIIGVGLNVENREVNSLEKIKQPVTSLLSEGVQSVDRNQLIGDIVNRLVKLLMIFPQAGFTAYQVKWESYAAHIGEQVELQRLSKGENQVVVAGELKGVNRQGCLCVQDAVGKIHEIIDSELSLRLL